MECCGKQIWTNLTKEMLGRLMIGRPDEVIRGAVKANWDAIAKPLDNCPVCKYFIKHRQMP